MTSKEYYGWVDFHCSHYQGLAEWLTNRPKLQEDRPDLETGTAETHEVWYRVLKPHSRKHANEATAILFSKPADDQPIGYSAHPRAIAEICRELEKRDGVEKPRTAFTRTVGGQRTYRCLTCLDSGWVPVWGHLSVEHAEKILREGVPEDWHPDQVFDTGETTRWNGRELRERAGIYSALAACGCAAGEKHAGRGTPVYSETSFCRIWGTNPYRDAVGWGTEQEIAYLVHWVADRLKSAPARQLPAF